MSKSKIKKTPIGAIREKCIGCAESKQDIKNCEYDCYCHPYRLGKNPNRKGLGGAIATISGNLQKSAVEMAKKMQSDHVSKVLSPLLSIRKECVACSGGQPKEVKECPVTDCPLYLLRFGKKLNK